MSGEWKFKGYSPEYCQEVPNCFLSKFTFEEKFSNTVQKENRYFATMEKAGPLCPNEL